MCIPVAIDEPLNPCKCLGSCRITRLLPLAFATTTTTTSRGPLLFRAVVRVLPHPHRQLVLPPPPHISTATDVGWFCVSFVAVNPPPQFYEFYQITIDKWWGRPYLKREFFHRIGEDMGDEVLLVVAEQQGETVAAALNMIGR
jgi:hypothetical protein